jgi:hypothetical protein
MVFQKRMGLFCMVLNVRIQNFVGDNPMEIQRSRQLAIRLQNTYVYNSSLLVCILKTEAQRLPKYLCKVCFVCSVIQQNT